MGEIVAFNTHSSRASVINKASSGLSAESFAEKVDGLLSVDKSQFWGWEMGLGHYGIPSSTPTWSLK